MRIRSYSRPAVLVIALLVVALSRAEAQHARRIVQWSVARSAAADMWFHALALLGVEGPGPLRYYSSAYAARVREEKLRRRSRPTLLDRNAARLRLDIQRDSAFEILHFLPLYVDAADPAELLAVVRDVATRAPAASGKNEMVAALRAVVRTDAERATLTLLADAIEDEWREFLRPVRASGARADEASLRRLQTSWHTRFEPVLGEFLERSGLVSGEIWVVPSLGAEGRVVTVSAHGRHAIVAVGESVSPDVPDASLLAAVREVCFPVLTAATGVGGRPMSRSAEAEARESSMTASSCGAALLDRTAPLLARDYRRLYDVPSFRSAMPR